MATSLAWSSLEPPLRASTVELLVSKFGFATMTPVQAATIPLLLKHRDVVAEAVTGSGKTLAFGVAGVELLQNNGKGSRFVCVAPTRELAAQTAQVMAKLGMCVWTCVGGESPASSATSSEASCVVGTPGRLRESLENGKLSAREVCFFVLDEADTLLDMGFSEEINDILRKMPKQRRTALFSATQTSGVDELAKAGLRNPATVRVRLESTTPNEIQNEFCVLSPRSKISTVVRLASRRDTKMLVFFDSCAAVDYFGLALRTCRPDLNVEALHGKMTQKKRTATWNRFLLPDNKSCLLCTDVAARGLDATDIDLVVQFDPPHNAETFVHRVGRTARAGRKGRALLFLEEHEDAYPELLRLRGVTTLGETDIDAASQEDDEEELRDAFRLAASKDRALMEKATRAFTAHVKSYNEHKLKYIFRWDKVDIGDIAWLYGILKLPKMPEISKAKAAGKKIIFDRYDVATSTVPFADKTREKARLKRNLKMSEDVADVGGANDQSSIRKDLKRKNPAATTSASFVGGGAADDDERKRAKKKGRHAQILEEWEDLAKEERLAKKLRQGKISKLEYEAQVRGEEEGETDETGGVHQQYQREKNTRKKKGLKTRRMAQYAASRGVKRSNPKKVGSGRKKR